MKIDGTDNTKLNDEPSTEINVYEDWIYYTVADLFGYEPVEENLGKLFGIKTDGTGRTEICKLDNQDNNARVVSVIGDWLYINETITKAKDIPEGYYKTVFYMIKTDGSSRIDIDSQFQIEAG